MCRSGIYEPAAQRRESIRQRRPSVRLQPIGEHGPEERPSGQGDTAAQAKGATPREFTPNAIDMDTVHCAGDQGQAGLVGRKNFMPTRLGEGARSLARSESATEPAVRSFVETRAVRSRTRSSRKSGYT